MEDEEFDAFVGVDWGEEEYEVCVLDPNQAPEKAEWLEFT